MLPELAEFVTGMLGRNAAEAEGIPLAYWGDVNKPGYCDATGECDRSEPPAQQRGPLWMRDYSTKPFIE